MPLYLNSLPGKGAHLVTVNDYLAQRDAAWMGGVLEFLGCSVGYILGEMTPEERREAVRLRRHLRHQQRVRLRLPAGQHGAAPGAPGALVTSTLPSSMRWTRCSSMRPARPLIISVVPWTRARSSSTNSIAHGARTWCGGRPRSSTTGSARGRASVRSGIRPQGRGSWTSSMTRLALLLLQHQPGRAQEQALRASCARSPVCWRRSRSTEERLHARQGHVGGRQGTAVHGGGEEPPGGPDGEGPRPCWPSSDPRVLRAAGSGRAPPERSRTTRKMEPAEDRWPRPWPRWSRNTP